MSPFCFNLATVYANDISIIASTEKQVEPAIDKNHELPGVFDIPKLKVLGFSDIGYNLKVTDNEDDNTFLLGVVSLFITSEITDRVNFLVEAEFHPDKDTNSAPFHTARANIKYSLSDIFNIKIGKMHTPLGYWNQAFHHGSWLQTTVLRPLIYSWEEEEGGFLPVHSFGIELFGFMEFDDFDLEYNFDVLNGRGKTITEIQIVKDNNDSKAINFLLGFRSHIIEGLKLGINFYLDTIPPNPNDAARINRIEERIIGGYATYMHDGLEILGEVFSIYHDDKTSGNDFNTLGSYLQAGYKINKLTPYYRFDYLDFESGDPYFTPNDIDISKHTFGVRWDAFNWNALKIEYSYNDKQGRDNEHSFTLNTSFAF